MSKFVAEIDANIMKKWAKSIQSFGIINQDI